MKTHDIQCQYCDKPAELNLCNEWQLYKIKKNGDYSDKPIDTWSGDGSEDLCQECYDGGKYY